MENGKSGKRIPPCRIVLEKIFAHNQWANLTIFDACAALGADQLDAEPKTVAYGSIRATLTHIATAQAGYLALLRLPVAQRVRITPEFHQLKDFVAVSGDGLLILTSEDGWASIEAPCITTDGFEVDPWVVMLQAINHATEHREQICSMVSSMAMTPPELDGWAFGLETGSLRKILET
ncbi:MAG: hypothetical protein LC723_13670 [Actinobacteria bacterium]|nr:hypothetical protein [Actinomycetota bacterium]